MIWSKYFSLFLASTVKFMFAPLGGIPLKLSFMETYLSCVAGALTTATVFFYGSEYFIIRSIRRQESKIQKAIASGKKIPTKKKFTFANKLIVRIKKAFGIYGICLWAPLFLSIPGGSIVSAKFYGKDKRAFPLIVAGVFLNGFIITSLVYLKEFFN